MNAPLYRSTAEETARHGLAWAVWPSDLATPVRLFLALRAAGHHACLLESVEGPARLARYSFVGVDPIARFRGRHGASVVSTADGERKLPGSVHGALRTAAGPVGPPPPRGLPPFLGGWIGWFAYEWASALEPRVPRAARDPWNVPDATLDLYQDVLALDHAAQKLFVVTRSRARHERIDALAADALASDVAASGDLRLQGDFASRTEPAVFEKAVESLRTAISHGEIFQAVLSQRFEQRFTGDPFTLYRVLRLANPSPHMFFFEADGITLVGSSPERLVSMRDGKAENRPIAGTRPRADDPLEDERLARELRSDPKERAEHDMLVDLARNDLGRVARIGTVHVKEHAVLERFARVQHLVSRVECDLAAGRDALDVLAASFPAGTVSGAPKVRAMELVAALEPETRGPYAGAFGYLDAAGNLDTALVIRTLVARAGVLSVQAGAGIVWDSDPAREREETLHKARALFEAAREADSPAFRASACEVASA
ncbi:MAG TPA: anthranilate synthase component I family protein [Planctomycetota bacterium]|nr:anthranilate synthase component I family protein [Planctomycetota bacterium]